MRIAHFIHRYPPALGGAESYFARLSRWLAGRGDDVTVFTTTALDVSAFWSPLGKCLPANECAADGVRVRRYPLWRMPGRRWLLKPLSMFPHRRWQCLTQPCNPISLGMWRDAKRLEQEFDLVHAAAFPYAFPLVCGLRFAQRQQIPYFVTPFLHTGNPDDPRDPVRRAYTSRPLLWILRQADGVFVQTPSERQVLIECGIEADRIILQGLGVEPAESTGGDRQKARRRWSVEDSAAVVGHLANNSEEKGTVDLLRAAAILWEQGQSFHVVLAGPEMPNFQRFWRTYPQKSRVTRLGPIDDNGKRDFFAGIDLFVLPSRSDSFGLVLLEAWANAKPNVAYRAGGVADVIRHEVDGLLVRCGDLEGLGATMSKLLVSPNSRFEYGKAGQDRLLTEFCWQDKLGVVRSVYENHLLERLGA